MKTISKKQLLTLNIQFFADGEGGNPDSGAGTGQSSPDGGQGSTQSAEQGRVRGITFTSPDEVPEYNGGIEPFEWEHQPRGASIDENHDNNSLSNQLQQEQTTQNEQKNEEPKENNELPEFDFGGRKVRPNDPESIKGAYEDWQNAQRMIQQLQQQTNQYEQFLNNLHQMGVLPNQDQQGQQGQQNNQQQQPAQPNIPTPSAERMQQLHDEYMNRMYENKFEADLWWEQQPEVQAFRRSQTEQFVNPIIEPIQQERQSSQKVNEMKSKYADFDEYVSKMQEIIDQRPDLNSIDQIENVYWIAKAQALESRPAPEQLLQDPQFQQQILQDESIRNQILQNYQSQKQNQARQAPPMMGNRPGGNTPTYNYRAPRSIREAGKLVRQNLLR